MNRSRRCGVLVRVSVGAALIAGLAGCEGRWAADWGGSAGCHSGYGGYGHVEGGGAAGFIILGAVAIAWGIHEIIEACR
jgi:hypothetical protein